jgi:phytoene dehydrogenase-like protein
MDHDADVIIIGAGHNSLTSALYLQKAGLKVLLVDLAQVPGGAAKSGEILEAGFKHDLFATNIGLFLGSQVYADFKDELHQNGFGIVAGDLAFSSVFPDGKCIRVYKDANLTFQEFERYSSKDAASWQELVGYFQKVAPYLFPLLQMPMPSFSVAKQLWRTYRGLGQTGLLDLIRLLIMPSRTFLDERFEAAEPKALMSPWAFHLGLSPDCAGGATFSFLESVADHLNGLALSRNGVDNLINALVKAVKDRGGKFLLGNRVTKIQISDRKATGITTADGRSYSAKKAVMACVTPDQFIKLIDEKDLPNNYVVKSKNYLFGPGTLMVHLTLDHPLEWNAALDLSDSTYVHVAPYMSDIATTYSQIMNGYIPRSPLLVVAQQSRLDPSRAPDGKHVLWVQARAFPRYPTADACGEIKGESWDEVKEAVCDRIIDKVEQFAPNIKSVIRKRVVHSPLDLEREDPNIVGGDMVGGCHSLNQNFMFRPFAGWSRYKTPIERLYVLGHSTWPGGGLNATSGHLAAMRLLKEV